MTGSQTFRGQCSTFKNYFCKDSEPSFTYSQYCTTRLVSDFYYFGLLEPAVVITGFSGFLRISQVKIKISVTSPQ